MKARKAAGGIGRKLAAVICAAACTAALSPKTGLGLGSFAEEEEAEITAVTVETVLLDEAGDFTATVWLDELPETGICALDFAIAYDPAVLKIDNVNLLYDTGAENVEILVNPDFAGTVFSYENTAGELRIRWGTGLSDPEFWLREERAFFTVSGHFGKDAGPGSGSALKIVPATRETAKDSGVPNSSVTAGYLDEEGGSHICDTRLTNGGVWVILDETGATRYGDLNMDGDITVSDAILMYRVLAEESALSAAAYANADCEFDEVLTIADVSLMLRVINGELEAKALGAH